MTLLLRAPHLRPVVQHSIIIVLGSVSNCGCVRVQLIYRNLSKSAIVVYLTMAVSQLCSSRLRFSI